ncbi:MAG: PHB depolymerase family esterase [Mucilaginibacter sp.]
MKMIIFCLLALTSLASAQPSQKNEELVIDGISRKFTIYIPSKTSGAKLPVLISLHGRLGTGEGMMDFADFRPIAEREQFIIVCPGGIDRSWNDGRPTPAQKKGINDVKFIDQLITYISHTYNGDERRVYVTGMSNGGFLASRLACELSSRIAAIAVVGASMDKNMDYHPGKPIPAMYIQGTKDPLVPYDGGTMKGAGGEIYGHADVLKVWAEAGRCIDKPIVTHLPDEAHDGTAIIKEEYSNPASGLKVVGYTVTNGGHTWPGGTQYIPKFVIGAVSHNLNACEVIWQFFKGNRLADHN